MSLQHVDAIRQTIDGRFTEFKTNHPERLERRMEMS